MRAIKSDRSYTWWYPHHKGGQTRTLKNMGVNIEKGLKERERFRELTVLARSAEHVGKAGHEAREILKRELGITGLWDGKEVVRW